MLIRVGSGRSVSIRLICPAGRGGTKRKQGHLPGKCLEFTANMIIIIAYITRMEYSGIKERIGSENLQKTLDSASNPLIETLLEYLK
jgi:hypothetical protein